MGVFGTVISCFTIDRFGRRVLLLISMSVMCVTICGLGVYFYLDIHSSTEGLGWLPLVCLAIYNTAFAMGIAPVPWLMNGELFAPDVRATGAGIATMTTWVLASVITKTFVNLEAAIGKPGTYWLFTGFSFVGVLFIAFVVPETKGKSLVEIQKMLE
ncbi:facilitated trehalose transporter Tret1-like [Lutzomyia longipalpis]|uniref:facilitated trehalose transporter Tret1-like n=1 Tax=Lutzomyia longipalpis TaxID=7200 RepID=UPI00248349BE|nr:facilitated trehalose transporter Tret1-like [Lutzomyia longipalpis]